MIANYHTHTSRCQHAWGEDKEYVEQAIAAGMQVLGFSDHCPWIYPDGYVSPTRMRPEQLDDYFTSMDKLKREYARDITIYAGFESEFTPELMEAQQRLLADYPVDYMILGQHFIGREPQAPYTGFPTEDESVLCQYVDTVIEGMETGLYRYVAHPDLMCFTGADEVYDKHFGRLCQYLKEKDIPVEINLLGAVEGRHYPSAQFLRLAQQMGNSAIIGCDAHTPDRLNRPDYVQQCEALADQFQLPLVEILPGLGPDSK